LSDGKSVSEAPVGFIPVRDDDASLVSAAIPAAGNYLTFTALSAEFDRNCTSFHQRLLDSNRQRMSPNLLNNTD